MFISHKSYLEGRPGFPGLGRIAWRMIERETVNPWYHVSLRFTVDGRQCTKSLMPNDASLLSDLLALQSPTFLIDHVQVVTAPWLNGGSLERMEKLLSLVIGCDQNGERVMLHTVASGAVYSSIPDCLDVSSLSNIQTIYEYTKSAHSPAQECA